MAGRRIYLYFFAVLLFFSGCIHGDGDDLKDALRNDTAVPPKNGSTFSDILSINENMGQDRTFSVADNGELPSLLEGDMIVEPNLIYQIKAMKAASDDGIGVFEAINHGQWPNAVVPYTYENGYVQNKLVRVVNAAVSHFAKYTCIKWQYYSPTAIRQFRNYVTFFVGQGCYSHVGRQGTPQKISIGRGCETGGIVAHEMMHALGFYHEQSRQDRDNYIRINWRNIPERLWYAFEKYRPGTASGLGFAYDKQSIMHYDNYAFAINRRVPTIVSKSNPRETFGQRKGLSQTDVAQLTNIMGALLLEEQKRKVARMRTHFAQLCQLGVVTHG